MSTLVARPVSHRSEVRTFALGLCAFLTGFSALVAADAYMNSVNVPLVPLYPNATLVADSIDSPEMTSSTTWLKATYTTSDKPDEVQRFYEKALWENGWSKSLCGYYQSRHPYFLQLRISPRNGSTTISISAQRGKIACMYTGGEGPHLAVPH
jgi:hypothetical protein